MKGSRRIKPDAVLFFVSRRCWLAIGAPVIFLAPPFDKNKKKKKKQKKKQKKKRKKKNAEM